MTKCPLGKYCEDTGLSTPTGSCNEGYYCMTGSSTKVPVILATEFGARCTKSSYCASGTSTPV